jgi:hypothetical protein
MTLHKRSILGVPGAGQLADILVLMGSFEPGRAGFALVVDRVEKTYANGHGRSTG